MATLTACLPACPDMQDMQDMINVSTACFLPRPEVPTPQMVEDDRSGFLCPSDMLSLIEPLSAWIVLCLFERGRCYDLLIHMLIDSNLSDGGSTARDRTGGPHMIRLTRSSPGANFTRASERPAWKRQGRQMKLALPLRSASAWLFLALWWKMWKSKRLSGRTPG